MSFATQDFLFLGTRHATSVFPFITATTASLQRPSPYSLLFIPYSIKTERAVIATTTILLNLKSNTMKNTVQK